MTNYIKAELIKQKRSFNNIILWFIPVVTVILAFLLVDRSFIQITSYNWFYNLFLPFVSIYISSTIIKKEKRFNYHGLFGVIDNKKKLWYAKVGTAAIYVIAACLLFSVLIVLSGIAFHGGLSLHINLIAVTILLLTSLWQIPLFMMVTLRFNNIIAILVSIFCNFVIGNICAVRAFWWIPFAIPARLMCPIIKVLPNGLPVSPDSPISQGNVILPGLLITTGLFILLLPVTAKYFENKEV